MKKHDWVVIKKNPNTLGRITRVSKKHGWADIEWIIGTRKRMKIELLEVVA